MNDLYRQCRPQLPASYVAFIEVHGAWEGDLGDNLGYVVLWDPASIRQQYASHEMAQHLGRRWFPFGSNGGGEMLCFDLTSATDQVFRVPFIGMSEEEAMPCYNLFTEVAEAVVRTSEPGAAPDGGCT